MNNKFQKFAIMFLLIIQILHSEEIKFSDYFSNQTMRMDYNHIGNSRDETIMKDQIYIYGKWAGNPDKLIDNFDNGKYYYKIFDDDSKKLIFSRGFCSYFGEYQTTEPALAGKDKHYHETVLFPCPKRPVLFIIEKRDRKNRLKEIYKVRIDPNDIHIINEKPDNVDYIYKIHHSGNPHKKVDIAIIGDGYKKIEKVKFKRDLKKYVREFFKIEPYKSMADKFNIYGVLCYSTESGIDEPTKGIYKNSVVNSSFNALDTPRYLLTEDNKSLRDIAAQVPYDAVMIMVNVDRYGGGGIYNFYCTFTASRVQWNEWVFLHEFGHSFAGLADEYYTSNVAYNDFYPKGLEPVEPNITALLDPDNVKWKDYISPGLEIPTEWGKEVYDSLNNCITELNNKRIQQIERLRKIGTSDEQIEKINSEFYASRKVLRREAKDFMNKHPLRGKIGVFEGAGYSSEGIYRPTVNSMMHIFSDRDKCFYKVNEEAIIRMIKFFTE